MRRVFCGILSKVINDRKNLKAQGGETLNDRASTKFFDFSREERG
jgi:hypothetical protein